MSLATSLPSKSSIDGTTQPLSTLESSRNRLSGETSSLAAQIAERSNSAICALQFEDIVRLAGEHSENELGGLAQLIEAGVASWSSRTVEARLVQLRAVADSLREIQPHKSAHQSTMVAGEIDLF